MPKIVKSSETGKSSGEETFAQRMLRLQGWTEGNFKLIELILNALTV